MANFKGITLPDGTTYFPEGGGSVPVIDDTWDELLNKKITLESEVQSLEESLNNSNQYSQYFLQLSFSKNGTGEASGNITVSFNKRNCGYFAVSATATGSQFYDFECYEYPVPHILRVTNSNAIEYNLSNVQRQDRLSLSRTQLGKFGMAFTNPYSGTITIKLYGKGVIS